MNEIVTQQVPAAPARAAGPQPIYPHDYDSAWRMSNAISKSGLAPKGIQTPEAIFTAIQLGAEVGLSPMSALQNIAVVNGRPTIWGDAQLALVRASGLLASFEERYEGEGDNMKAICVATRAGYSPSVGEFSVQDAKTAGLWNKDGPWRTNPKRMLKMRARAFALRDGFTDVLKGIYSYEEIVDAPPLPGEAQVVNTTSAADLNKEFLTLDQPAGEAQPASTAASAPDTGKTQDTAEPTATVAAATSTPAPAEATDKEAKNEAFLNEVKNVVDSHHAAVTAKTTDFGPLDVRKKSAETLLDNLQAADPADRDDMLAKAGGQNFLMQLNKDGLYDLVKGIKKAAGLN